MADENYLALVGSIEEIMSVRQGLVEEVDILTRTIGAIQELITNFYGVSFT